MAKGRPDADAVRPAEEVSADKASPYLREVNIRYQNAAVRQARTACDVSNKYDRGSLSFRSRKRGGRTAIECG